MTNDTNITTNEEVSLKQDKTMDISSLLKTAKTEEKVAEKPKSNLEKMKEAKENSTLGLVVDKKDMVDESEKELIMNKSEHDAMNEADVYMQEQERLIATAKKVRMEKIPTNPIEMASTMSALDTIAKGEDIKLMDGEELNLRPKTKEELEAEAKGETLHPIGEDVENDGEEIPEEKKALVNVIIDKTGLGGDFKFTDDERDKLFSATEIRLTEVEEVDLATIKVKKTEKSFLESVEEFQLSSSKVPVVFPASRFRAEMTGLSYGEMGDISLNGENITFDQIQKKLTVIYNKMVNPSIGKFESFEDFLRKFAYVDIDLAIYGLVVATFPEVDDIPLTCNNPRCGKSFNHKFSPRTLIRFEKANDRFLSATKEVIECPPEKANNLSEESPTRTYKRVKLPDSKFIIEIGIASSYDYLYTIVDNILGDKFKEQHPDDVNGILQLNTTLLGLIRGVYVPRKDGEYEYYDEFEDMIQALYMIKPNEVAILSSLLTKYTEGYSINFELVDIVCPHCGTKTRSIPLDINYLVFLKYQRLMSSELNTDNILVL